MPNEIQVKWAAEGGATGPIGQPIAAATMVSSYCSQSFEGGFIAAHRLYRFDTTTSKWVARWETHIVRKNSGATGPRWYALGASIANSIPSTDETFVAGGSYQEFLPTVSTELIRYIFAPVAGPPFEVGATAPGYPDQTYTAISAAAHLFSKYPDNWTPERLFSEVGIPDKPTSCALTRGGCETFFGGGAWRYIANPVWPAGAYQPASPIGVAYAAQGGEAGPLGYPNGIPACQGTDCRLAFESADLSQYQGVAHLIQSPFRYVSSAVATTDAVCGLADGRCKQEFTDATVYKLVNGNTTTVTGAFRDRWLALGGEAGLGFPLAGAVQGPPAYQQFEHGTLASGPATQTGPPVYVIYGGIGFIMGGVPMLGSPLGEEVCGTAPAGGCYQWFEYGIIWWSPATGAHTLRNDSYLSKYQQLNWAWGPLGYPIGEYHCSPPNDWCEQTFQGGTIVSSQRSTPDNNPGYPFYWVHGAIGAKYASLNWAWGPLGFPSSDEDCSPSGSVCRQEFNNGTIWWSPSTGAHALHGDIRRAWEADGRVTGVPVEDEQCTGPNGGCHQTFQNGLYWWSPNTGSHFVRAGMLAVYASLGWAWGPLGVPLNNEYAYGDGSRQDFEHGAIIWHPDGHFDVIPW